MGVISVDKINDILNGAKDTIAGLFEKIDSLTLYQVYFLIIIIGQYLYARFASNGTLNGDEYEIVPRDVRNAISSKTWAPYAENIILARNTICHEVGHEEAMRNKVNKIANNKSQIKMFLKYLGFGAEENPDVHDAISRLIKSASIG